MINDFNSADSRCNLWNADLIEEKTASICVEEIVDEYHLSYLSCSFSDHEIHF